MSSAAERLTGEKRADAAFVKQYYQDQAVARAYDRQRFHGLVGRTFDYLEKRAIGRLVRRVRRLIPHPRVLDVPCGTGRITELLLAEGLEGAAGDISPAMMEVARERCGPRGVSLTFQRLDLDALELPDSCFDLVTCIRLFHHLESVDRARILRELARVTRRFVLVNVALSTSFYRLRRRLKRALRQGVSRTNSTWEEIRREAAVAGLVVRNYRFILPYLSEDLVLLLEKV